VLKGSNFDNPKRFIPVLGGPLEKHMDLAKKLSPILYLHAGDPPLFLAQGTNDVVLSDQNVIQMAAAARKDGIPTTLLLVKGAGHGFGGDKIDPPLPEVLKETSDFLLKYLLPGAK
jgi:dipeptidyl aminopeptidase/acylaminoacyl peptidase